jgi:hypothetical protein
MEFWGDIVNLVHTHIVCYKYNEAPLWGGGCHCPFSPCLFCTFLVKDSGFRDKGQKGQNFERIGNNLDKKLDMLEEISYSSSKM